MENRAYALLTVKAVEDEEGVIRGIASTPTADRMGDVVVPEGAEFKLPLPLLWQHDSGSPIGQVTEAKVTKNGIEIVATIARGVSDEIDKAWNLIKAGLVRGLSIGFRGLDVEQIPNSWGVRFKTWEWLELSAVTIPANAEASITTLKSIVSEQTAASGRSEAKANPAASGDNPKPVVRRKQMAKKSIADQIAEWQETRTQKSAEMAGLYDPESGETMDAATKEAFDTLEAEIEEIDATVKRLKVLQKNDAETARDVKSDQRVAEEVAARAPVQVKAPEPEAGIRFARYAKCLGIAHKTHRDPVQIAQEMYGERDPKMVNAVKAAVIASNTTTDAALIGNEGGWADFVEFLRPRTILGRFGSNGIPGLTRIPFRVPLITEGAESAAGWVGEGKAKPLTKPAWTRTEMTPLKIAAIAVATMEQLRDSSPSGEMLIRDSIAKSIAKGVDQAFIDPSNSGTPNIKPAAITNGLSGNAFAATGQDTEAVYADVQTAIGKFIAANNSLSSGVWVMSATTALALSMLRNALGGAEFPGLTMNGGAFFGLPVITSQYVSGYVALINAEDVYFGDEGGVSIDMSTEASLEMMDNPTGDSVASTPVPAELVSLWQTNSAAFRAERTVNWMRRRSTAVVLISSVTWGVGAT